MLRAPQLYMFLMHCEMTPLPKEILECGVGTRPDTVPLFARFAERGYAVRGIEISDPRLQNTRDYCAKHGIDADLRLADMRELPFGDASIPFLFSYNSIFHMTKADIAASMKEIGRVLMPGGNCFVNFASVDDDHFGTGRELKPGEFEQQEGDSTTIHSYYEPDEAAALFDGLIIDHMERRVVSRRFTDGLFTQGYIDFVARKPES